MERVENDMLLFLRALRDKCKNNCDAMSGAKPRPPFLGLLSSLKLNSGNYLTLCHLFKCGVNQNMSKIKPLSFTGNIFNVIDVKKFKESIRLLKESLFDAGDTLYIADNLITWNKNYTFLRDPFYIDIINDPNISNVEKSILWRTYVLMYFAELSMSVDGDFIECGVLEGTTAFLIDKKLDLGSKDKDFYLFDLFEWNTNDAHDQFPQHFDKNLADRVKQRFISKRHVHVIKGRVPDSFAEKFPDRISFAHIDMNNEYSEAAALKHIIPLLSPGGSIVLDDYGWWGYSAQKASLDPIITEYGLKVLELPTGQGILQKPVVSKNQIQHIDDKNSVVRQAEI